MIETETSIVGLLAEIWIVVAHAIQDPQDVVLIQETVLSDFLLEKPTPMYLVGVEDQPATDAIQEIDHPPLLAQYQIRAHAHHPDAVIVHLQDPDPHHEDADPELALDHQIDELHIGDEVEEAGAEVQTVGIAVGDHQLYPTVLVHALALLNEEELRQIQPVDLHHQGEHAGEALVQYQIPGQNPGRDLCQEQDPPFPGLSVVAPFVKQPTVET